MSYLITVEIPGDVETFRKEMANRPAELVAVSERGRAAGAIHHRFGVADGMILVVDEWDDPKHFEAFFGEPKMVEFVHSMGADPSRPPRITVAESMASPDEF